MDVHARRTRTALQLLKQDHHIAAALFDRYQHAVDDVERLRIAQLITHLVTSHARCEDVLRHELKVSASSPQSRGVADRQLFAMLDRINDPDIPQWTFFVDSMQVQAANAERNPSTPRCPSDATAADTPNATTRPPQCAALLRAPKAPALRSEPHKETDDVR